LSAEAAAVDVAQDLEFPQEMKQAAVVVAALLNPSAFL
jgi:hypothetical protein